MAILNNSNAISSGGYDINNSLRFRASASANLTRTTSAGSSTTATWSFWMKRGSLAGRQVITGWSNAVNTAVSIEIDANNNFKFNQFASVDVLTKVTSQVFRDPSAWYHIVVTLDTTNATAEDRARIYVNGSRVTNWTTNTNPSLNYATSWGSSLPLTIGNQTNGATYFDGYLAEWNFIDGQALTPSSFGETDTTTGSWKPKAYTGTYGTNGFYLKFSDIATTSGSNAGLGKDFSGNANYWTTNNISVTAGTTYDAMIDSPTLTSATVANYAVMNPLDNNSMTLSAANLDAAGSTTYGAVRSTIAVSSGKYYFEINVLQNVSGNFVGIAPITSVFNTTTIYPNALAIDNSTIVGIKTVGVTMDFDNLECKFYVNNVLSSTQTIVAANAPYAPFVADGSSGNNASYSINFGQRPFTYTPPTGFKALNTFNLPDSTILKGNTVMDATLYTGNGGTQSVTNAGGFSPDFVWIKSRSAAENNAVFDSVRGVTNYLLPNSTSSELNFGTFGVTAFNSNGFTVIGGSGYAVNTSAATYVAWQWDAGSSTVTNTSGSISSQVRANATAGFSVVTYTGTGSTATIGHGLGVAPKMIICKSRSATGGWNTYHADLGNTKGIYLNLTQATTTSANFWNNTSPTSTVFTLSGANETNTNGSTNVAYCWAEIAGFSRFGSYTGNGSADGPFIATNFKPKYVLIKNTTNYDWHVFDAARNTYNFTNSSLKPNTTGTEFTNNDVSVDFLSNGFKLRGTDLAINGNGNTHIYACFASNPFKISNAV